MDKIIIYNPRDGAEINDIYAQKKWKHEVNTIKKYPQHLAQYLLSKFGFLQEVHPKDLVKIKELAKAKYECDYKGCDYVANTKNKLQMHKLGKHKLTKELKEQIDGVEEAKSSGKVEVQVAKRELSPEEIEGIPNTKAGEKDGWYGPGWEADKIGSGMMRRKQPGVTPGHFG